MSIVYKEFITPEDYNTLREAAGWGQLLSEQAEQSLAGSAYVVSCYDDNKIVGSARVIWDRGYVSYLADVMVVPEYQGMGIGKKMVEMSLTFMKSQLKEGWKIKMVLVSAKGRETFYRQFGFMERPNENFGAGMDMWLT